MPETAYQQLRRILDTHPCGCPDEPEIIDILKILFDADEVCAALGLGFKPLPAKTVAKRAQMPESRVEDLLTSLAGKGIVFARKKGDVWRYALLPVMPGLFEFPYMKNDPLPDIERLSVLWKTYLKKLARDFGSPSTSFSRIVPVQETIGNRSDILPYEQLHEMIDRAQVVGIAKCACRESEGNCDAPKEACMLFDDTCTYLVERGFGRYISKDEMKRKLKAFDEAGLVHQTNNAQDRLTFICNCCPCCCGLLRSYTELKNPNVLISSGFFPSVDAARCTACGICADERCPMGAIMLVDAPVIDMEKCIGCGLCVTGCPEQALTLVRREVTREVAPTSRDMGMRILQDKGKLEAFLPYLLIDSD